MLQREVLVFEFTAKDGLATRTIESGEITALDHEVFDDAMEDRTLFEFGYFNIKFNHYFTPRIP